MKGKQEAQLSQTYSATLCHVKMLPGYSVGYAVTLAARSCHAWALK